jgi:MtaA/CmuA family methyltransferase
VNGYQRIQSALHGEWPDTVPVMLHNFMMAAHEAGVSMARFRSDPEAIARSFIQAVETYEYDGVILDIDTVTLAGAVGVPIDFPEDSPARVRGARLEHLRDVENMQPVDITRYHGVQVWLEAARLLHRHFGDEVFIRGNCEQCPFSLAAMVRGMDAWLMDLLDPESEEDAHRLLERCTATTLRFVELMAVTGVHMTSNGDSPAGPELVSPAIYRKFALPYERIIVNRSHELGFPHFLHICGNTDLIIDDMLQTGSDGLELDYKTNVHLAHRLMKDRAVFSGNIDPSGVLALGTASEVAKKTLDLLSLFSDTPRFILNAGCAIPPTTPPENLRTMIHVARTFKRNP